MLDASDTARLKKRWLPGVGNPVKAAAIAGAPAGVLFVWVLEEFVVHRAIPGVVAVAIGSLMSSAAAFLTRAGRVVLYALEHEDKG